MKNKPTRNWHLVLTLGIPLTIVGASAMAISYATLIDVARVNGLPLPELFPVLIDVGTVATMIAAAQFRLRGIDGRWLAYVAFIALSAVSIVANASHAWRAADMTVTTPWAAAILAATPPAALLAITHLVMMLIPDEKERAKLQAVREKQAEAEARHRQSIQQPASVPAAAPVTPAAAVAAVSAPAAPLRLVEQDKPAAADQAEVREKVLAHIAEHGERPTGAIVGDWLGKSYKTGQRFLQKLEESGELNAAPVSAGVSGIMA
ncbi:hypothetical protein [Leucobacter aridicollis]|uniref:DUF2637 domain-containing protein n=1 Tax=Leucobacter aridicollis TaxID=283878 RepID=A0A852R4X3_9MICO|nr:hypothetical protein [Leucobacter aridicollis]MBL3681158.1 hypothetical protein [Leucobacter aridicollis]NYD27827.1 hypothetical protein [Leucobacter aridicollis]